MTAVQPAARAAPSFRVIMADGKFHGVKIDLMNDVRSISEANLRVEHAHHTWRSIVRTMSEGAGE